MVSKLEVQNAQFSYDGKTNVFSGVSLTLNPGEWLCLLGPNGSGKTTLLRCLCRLLHLKVGKILLNGRDLNSQPIEEIGKKIGFIPQTHQPSFPYTVTDVVLLGRTPHLKIFESPTNRDYEIAYRSMESVGILSLKDRPYTQLSGGQLQLVTIARALTQEPEILLLDEPTSHLDLPNQFFILHLLKRLSEKGITIIMTSHYPDQALLASGKAGLLHNGNLIAFGRADDVLTEQNLCLTYGIEIKIVHIGYGIDRKICVPMIKLR